MNTSARALLALFGTASAVIALAGCSVGVASPAPASSKPKPAASAAATQTLPVVPGYDVGEFPPVPLFRLPDLSLLDSASASGFTIDIKDDFAKIPGVTVSPAHCDAGGEVVAGNGSAYLYGDGSGNYIGSDGSIQNYGDGSGSFTLNGITVQNYGDGSGNYAGNGVTIQNYGDGSGNYTDSTMTVQIYGDGSGNYTGPDGTIQNYGDGSGNFAGNGVTIHNYGDGSGNYAAPGLTIENYGDGTGKLNGKDIKVDPIAPVAKLGVFPPLAALQPITSCGTVITFDAGVLFDFDKFSIRPDAAATLKTVAAALTEYKVANAVVSGHTDAKGSDDYNQTLSEKRAASVVAALKKAGVSTDLTAEGYGESRPVAANEVDGKDNPAGRQLNRRVEIFIPASL